MDLIIVSNKNEPLAAFIDEQSCNDFILKKALSLFADDLYSFIQTKSSILSEGYNGYENLKVKNFDKFFYENYFIFFNRNLSFNNFLNYLRTDNYFKIIFDSKEKYFNFVCYLFFNSYFGSKCKYYISNIFIGFFYIDRVDYCSIFS